MRRLLPFALAATALCGCSNAPAPERIDDAEQSLRDGDMEAARRGVENVDTAELSAAELCRMAVVYAAVGEDNSGNEGDIGMAARCMRRALAKDSAAVDSFIRTMPPDQRPLMSLAVQLCSRPADIHDFEEPDTLINP
ncbi:MAG: hypothetical protein JFR38_05145 [Muribaculaceae bacterium]|nr:hypothetical protein [Muribaculaceae bacterium]